MIKDIKYNGYTAQPSDYESPDGDLALSLNLLNEDGNIKSIPPPRKSITVSSGHEIILLHNVPGQENLIILTGDRSAQFGISWIKRDESLSSTENASAIQLKSPFNKLLDITIVGNTLAIATSGGVHYILWKDDNYKYLGNRPPFVPISFGAYKQGDLTKSTTTTYATVPPCTYNRYSKAGAGGGHIPHDITWTSEDDAFWASVSNQALGLLLSQVADRVTSDGHMYQPFFVRYAFKLYDGSYSWHSAPILILVSTHRPVISISCVKNGDAGLNISCRLAVPYFGLAYQIYSDLDLLKEWSDIITGIDVFISQPIYTYSQGENMREPVRRYNLYQGLYAGSGGGRNDHFSQSAVTGSASDAEVAESTKVLTGHYATAIDGAYIDHYVTPSLSEMGDLVCDLVKNETFNDRLQHEYLFYKVASFDLDELKPMSGMKRLPLIKTDLSDINTLETLPDDYNSHATIMPQALYTYNRRLVMGDVSIRPPQPFPACSMVQTGTHTSGPDHETSVDARESIKVFTRVNGKKCVSQYQQSQLIHLTDPPAYPFADCFPRYIYHPDPSAYKMEITTPDGDFFSIPLKQHPHLNGAYWFGGLLGSPTGIEDDKDLTSADSAAVIGNKIYISDIDNPFRFPVENIVTIGCGRIYRIISAAKALSQGQFGQFPLYAFTDDGIWALEISPTGTIAARQPITRDVCINPDGITQLDNAVLFPTDRGIMLISGSQTQCISDAINSSLPPFLSPRAEAEAEDNPTCPPQPAVPILPGLDKLHHMLGHTPDTCLPTLPFTDYLRRCRMIYDYIHQRVIVYAPGITYAYVFSLKSKLWGMIFSNIASHLNSYPEALAVDNENHMIDFSQTDSSQIKSLLITRPLKLDTPDIHKTIDTIIQRGHFRKGHVRTILYGSRDLFNWHIVWSSTNHYLRGFRGTPYKYFRIALLCNLTADESILGATLQFTPRLTNQPR